MGIGSSPIFSGEIRNFSLELADVLRGRTFTMMVKYLLWVESAVGDS